MIKIIDITYEEFHNALRQVLENSREREVDDRQIPRIREFGRIFSDYAGDAPVKVSPHPAFNKLGFTIIKESVGLKNAEQLTSRCINFSIIPRTDGKMYVSATISDIYAAERK